VSLRAHILVVLVTAVTLVLILRMVRRRRLRAKYSVLWVSLGAGLAVLATLAAERTDSLTASGTAHDVALNSGYHLAYLIGSGLVAAGLVAAFTVLRPAPMPVMHATAGETADGQPAYSEAA